MAGQWCERCESDAAPVDPHTQWCRSCTELVREEHERMQRAEEDELLGTDEDDERIGGER